MALSAHKRSNLLRAREAHAPANGPLQAEATNVKFMSCIVNVYSLLNTQTNRG